MNRFLVVSLLLCPTLALAAAVGHQNDVTLIIRGNGTGLCRNDSTQPRKMLEQQLKAYERFAQRSRLAQDDGSDEETDGAPAEAIPPATPEKTAPLSKEELTQKLKTMMNERPFNQMYSGGSNTLETIEVTDDTVRTVVTTEFASLEALVGGAMMRLGETGFNRVRLEQTTNSTLRLTLAHPGPSGQVFKSLLQMWRLTGTHGQLRIEFPGKVLSSSLPHTEGNATWLVIDARDTNVVAQLEKVHSADAVIEAEAGGVKLTKALDSMRLQMGLGRPEPDLPLSESQGGFVAEAKSAVQTQVYWFPGGQEALGEQEDWSGEKPGLQIQARLFPPRGRFIRVISDVTVVKAVDDKGRLLPRGEATTPDQENMIRFTSDPSENSPGAALTIQLASPPTDAKAVEELTAEAIVTTNEGWKELTIAKLETGTNATTVLTSVLPGATLRVKRVKQQQNNGEIEIEVTGLANVKQLDFQATTPTGRHVGSNAFDTNVRTEKGKTVRTITVSYYASPMGGDDEGAGGTGGGKIALGLRVRYPEKLRREKVTFKLEAIDLL